MISFLPCILQIDKAGSLVMWIKCRAATFNTITNTPMISQDSPSKDLPSLTLVEMSCYNSVRYPPNVSECRKCINTGENLSFEHATGWDWQAGNCLLRCHWTPWEAPLESPATGIYLWVTVLQNDGCCGHKEEGQGCVLEPGREALSFSCAPGGALLTELITVPAGRAETVTAFHSRLPPRKRFFYFHPCLFCC